LARKYDEALFEEQISMMDLGPLAAALKRSTIPGRIALIFLLLAAPKLVVPALQLLIPEARADSVAYAYDALGRVIQATDTTSGQAVLYMYDSAGNITSQQTVPITTLAISGFSMDQGATGTRVTIDGTGFSTTASGDVVEFNGVSATVVSATQTQLVVSIPAGATTGSVSVQTGTSTATSPVPFSVTAATAAPTIASFSPAAGAAGTAVTITGTNFLPALAANKVQINGVDALVSAVTPTTLTVVIPDDVGSGLMEVITPYGSGTSSSNFLVPPVGYSASSIASAPQASENGGTLEVPVGTNQIAIVLFNGTQGDQHVRAAIQGGGSGVTIEVVDPHGKIIASGCQTNCLYNLPTLTLTGTYAVVIAESTGSSTFPVTITTASTGSLDVGWSDGGYHLWSNVVNVSTARPDILSFSGTAGQLTQVYFRSIANSWTLSLWNSSGQTLWSSALSSSTSSVSLPALPANGSYSLVFDPQFTGGSIQYVAGIVASGALTVNGAAVTVNGGGPNNIDGGAGAEVTFAGAAGQNLNLSINASQGYFYDVEVNSLTTAFVACPFACSSGIEGGTCTYQVPTLKATGTYVVYIHFASSLYSTVEMSLSTTAGTSTCIGNIGSLDPKHMSLAANGVGLMERP
jgi:YD repeat-containing protein